MKYIHSTFQLIIKLVEDGKLLLEEVQSTLIVSLHEELAHVDHLTVRQDWENNY